ncbi:hypothetical protein RJT34_32605 [Clitoria ternatea]|uniref:Uncharacterized protein n=1 Tax=Clitoria ternatea TaxID=43366 RepID=A0AAN9F0L3_CLITE
MSFISEVIAPWCQKHANAGGVDGHDYVHATCIGGNDCDKHEDFTSFLTVASIEGDDDDDDATYDYAPAA